MHWEGELGGSDGRRGVGGRFGVGEGLSHLEDGDRVLGGGLDVEEEVSNEEVQFDTAVVEGEFAVVENWEEEGSLPLDRGGRGLDNGRPW